jgi:hypothetical protein
MRAHIQRKELPNGNMAPVNHQNDIFFSSCSECGVLVYDEVVHKQQHGDGK